MPRLEAFNPHLLVPTAIVGRADGPASLRHYADLFERDGTVRMDLVAHLLREAAAEIDRLRKGPG